MKLRNRSFVALIAMILLIIVQSIADPIGQLALVGWTGTALRFDLGMWPLALWIVFVPVLLVMTWWVTLRTGGRFWLHTAGLTLAVLLAQALTVFFKTWNVGISAWAAGYVTAKAVPAGLIIAGITRWLGGRAEREIHAYGSVWIPAIIFGVLTPLVAGAWWTGAPYISGGPIPRFNASPISLITGLALLIVITALMLNWIRPRVPGVLGGWVSAALAGAAFGLVQSIVFLLLSIGQPMGGFWPLISTYVTVADGLSYGVGLGWLIGIAVVILDRAAAAQNGSRDSRVVPAIAVTVVGALGFVLFRPATGLSGVNPSSKDRTNKEDMSPQMLRTSGDIIADGNGNQVLLRGVNVNQLVDFYEPSPGVPGTRPLTEADFEGMATYVFNVVSLNLSWSALEPERGTLDQEYLARIHQAVTWAKLASEFKDEPVVAGFDLLNQPGFGEMAPVTTAYQVGRFYDRATVAIREAGAPQIVFYEPSILWSGMGFDTGPLPGFTEDSNIVFSPHLYAESITMDRDLGLPPLVGLEQQFSVAQRVAEGNNAPSGLVNTGSGAMMMTSGNA